MNLLSLKYFITVSEMLSFTRAAEILYVSQPTLSRQIAELEEEFGVPLFIRAKRSISLTPEGEICLAEAKKIVQQCDALVKTLRMQRETISGHLMIGFSGHIEQDFLQKALLRIKRDYPNVFVEIQKQPVSKLSRMFADGQMDIIFSVKMEVESIEQVETLEIAENHLAVAISDTHILAKKDSVSFLDLKDLNFVMLERRLSQKAIDDVFSRCAENGFYPSVVHYFSDPQEVLYMVSAGNGIAFVPNRFSLQNVKGIKLLEIEDAYLNSDAFNLVLAYLKTNKNPMIPLFIQTLQNPID